MTLPLATHGYLVDDCPSSILAVSGHAQADAPPLPPCGPLATPEDPAPKPPTGILAVAFPLNPKPRPPTGKATLENPAPVAPQGKAVDQTPNPPPKPPKGKAEDV